MTSLTQSIGYFYYLDPVTTIGVTDTLLVLGGACTLKLPVGCLEKQSKFFFALGSSQIITPTQSLDDCPTAPYAPHLRGPLCFLLNQQDIGSIF